MKKMGPGLVYHVRHSKLVLLLIKLYSSSIIVVVLFSCSESHLHADHVLVIHVKLLSSGNKATWLYITSVLLQRPFLVGGVRVPPRPLQTNLASFPDLSVGLENEAVCTVL